MFDKDNTLTHPYQRDIVLEIKDSLDECQRVFSPENVAILSNTVGSSDDKDHKVNINNTVTLIGGEVS